MKLLNVKNQIDILNLLSSRTYPTEGFNQCVYCDESVENDYYNFNGDFYSYMPYRCNCKNAKQELLAKENLLKTLNILDNCINIEKINDSTKEYELSEINRKYEDNK